MKALVGIFLDELNWLILNIFRRDVLRKRIHQFGMWTISLSGDLPIPAVSSAKLSKKEFVQNANQDTYKAILTTLVKVCSFQVQKS